MNIGGPVSRAVKTLLPQWLMHELRWARVRRKVRRLTRQASEGPAKPHSLAAPLLVSLTSYPPRFSTLHLTLQSLINQSVAPDAILLWVARGDIHLLPRTILDLRDAGITVRECEDVGSYKKLIFALEDKPEAFIVTADDDLFYEPRWLETLVGGYDPVDGAIVCQRVHRLCADESGRIASYRSWTKDVQDQAARIPSIDLLPTTGSGVLFPPGCFSPEVTDRRRFTELCPTGDDLWFYWMSRKAGSKFRKVGQRFDLVNWPTRQATGLWEQNGPDGNDRQIRMLEDSFGNPLRDASKAARDVTS